MAYKRKLPHLIDMRIPDSEWEGYWCPVDKEFHKDGTTIFMNAHCIACKAMLRRRWTAPPGKKRPFTVWG